MRGRIILLSFMPLLALVSGCPAGETADSTAPAAVSDLVVVTHSMSSGSVILIWTAVADDGLEGDAAFSYEVRRHSLPIDNQNWDSAQLCLQVWIPANPGTREVHETGGLTPGTTYYFALKVMDEAGNASGISNSSGAQACILQDTFPPNGITDLAAQTGSSAGTVQLSWTASGDDSGQGTAAGYEVKYSESPITDANFSFAVEFPQSWTPLPAGQHEMRVLGGLTYGKNYHFAIRVRDEVPNVSFTSNCASAAAGGAWTVSYTHPQAALFHGIWGSSGSDVFAVGTGGLIMHFDGTTWTQMASPVAQDLYCVWGSGPSDVHAGGAAGTMLHYDGMAWTTVPSGTAGVISSISGSGASNAYAVGWDGVNLHWDGQSWSSFGSVYYLESAWCAPDGSVVAVGGICSVTIHINKVMRGTASAWFEDINVPSCDLSGVWGSSLTDVYAVGSACRLSPSKPNMVRFDGVQWTPIRRSSATLHDVWGFSAKSVYAVGAAGTVCHFDGTSWTQTASGIAHDLYCVWGSASSGVFAGGTGGIISQLK